MIHKGIVLALALGWTMTLTFADEPKTVTVGDKAPDFAALGIDGKEFRLSEQIASGESNVVLLFSRAHW